jgi:hypothetical protein
VQFLHSACLHIIKGVNILHNTQVSSATRDRRCNWQCLEFANFAKMKTTHYLSRTPSGTEDRKEQISRLKYLN